jgi:hypothetical protein
LCDNLFFLWISKCQIKNIKYIHQNLRIFFETSTIALFVRKSLLLLMIYKNKMVTLKNSILIYIGMNNINRLKRNCHVGINVVFLEMILKLYDVCFMKTKFHCHHTSWFFLIHLLIIRAIFKEFMHHLTHKFYIFFSLQVKCQILTYKFPQNKLYSYNIYDCSQFEKDSYFRKQRKHNCWKIDIQVSKWDFNFDFLIFTSNYLVAKLKF